MPEICLSKMEFTVIGRVHRETDLSHTLPFLKAAVSLEKGNLGHRVRLYYEAQGEDRQLTHLWVSIATN